MNSYYKLETKILKIKKYIKKILKENHSHFLKALVLSFFIFGLVLTGFYFPSPLKVGAAMYLFTQTDWSAGAASDFASHPNNQSNWLKFATSTAIVANSSLSLATTSAVLSGRTDVTKISPINLSPYPGFSNCNKIVKASDGTIYVVYYSLEYSASSTYNIALRSSADNFNSRVDVTTLTSGNGAVSPCIAIDSNNKIHIAYSSYEYNSSVSNIAYRNNISGNFNTRIDVTQNTTRPSSQPSLVIDKNGYVHIAYHSSEFSPYTNIAYRNNISGNFNTRIDVTQNSDKDSYYPSLAIDKNGYAHIAYLSKEYNSTYDNVAYRNNISGTFNTRIDVTTSNNFSSASPFLQVDSSGKAHILYSTREISGSSSGIRNISYRNNISDNFSRSVYITGAVEGITPFFIFDQERKLHITYLSKEYNASYYNVAYKTYQLEGYASVGSLLSSLYDTTDSSNVINQISWDENSSLPEGTSITVSLRTASSSDALLNASWNDFTNTTTNCTKSGGTVTCPSAAFPLSLKDGVNDRWFQYKITLTGGLNTPSFEEIRIQYVVNAPPQFDSDFPVIGGGGILANQIASSTDSNWGKVQVQYSVKDPDTNSGSLTPGFVTPSFEYNLGTGWVNIPSQYLSSNALENKPVSQTSFTQYMAYWDARSQIPGVYSSNAQIKVIVNDNEAANNLASTTKTLTLDTKDPTINVFRFDSTSDTVTLDIFDNSNLEFRLANVDFSASSTEEWRAVGGNSTSTTVSWTPSGAPSYETIYLQARDAYGNSTSSKVVVPYTPTNFDLKDTSNVSTNDYRLFLSWGVYNSTSSAMFSNYKLYRSTDGTNYSLLQTISDPLVNYFHDTGLASSTTYYYKLTVTDTDGDVSNYTPIVSKIPNGQGGTDNTPPAISLVSVETVQATWAKIKWVTDELSSSEVNYSSDNSFSSVASNPSYVLNHEVVLTNLLPNTNYFFRVKSTDVLNNTKVDDNGGAGFSFTTLGGPIISDVTTEIISDNSATIVWNTNKSSNSYVVYSTNLNNLKSNTNVLISGNAAMVDAPYQHRVTINNLLPRTTYYYYVKSVDSDNNVSIDTNGGNYFTFTTTYDTKPPVISEIVTPIITPTSASIVWKTDELANAQVRYGNFSGSYPNATNPDLTLSIYHTVSLTGLVPETTYYFKVFSTDGAGNSASSTEQTLKTTKEGNIIYISGGGSVPSVATDTTAPTISDINVSNTGPFTMMITFKTNEITTAAINVGETTSYDKSFADFTPSTNHAVKLFGLKMGTKYNFQIKVQDQSGNFAVSENQTFSTPYVAEAIEGLKILDSPEQLQTNLENIIESALPSLLPPFVSNVKVENVTENSAIIKWSTNVETYGSVAYSSKEDFNKTSDNPYKVEVVDPQSKTKNHEVFLGNLLPATTYHFQVRSFVFPKVVGKSDDITFVTKSLKLTPQISDVTNSSFVVSWLTSKKTSSFVEFRNTKTGVVSRVGNDDLTKNHIIKIENVFSGTTYKIRPFGYDEDGNLIEGEEKLVTVSKDTVPPTISSVSISNSFIPYRTNELQTVVLWKTDEPATSEVFFGEGINVSEEPSNFAGQKEEFVTQHTVIIPGFKPNAVYRLKVVSIDQSGNISSSPVKTIVTPNTTESVFEIMIKNFEEAFGFLKKK